MRPVIEAKDLSKQFKIYSSPWNRAVEWATFGRTKKHQEFWALKNISFELAGGECLGVIGPNGAGKSTLLKILTRALYPTTGSFEVKGRVLSLLELGTGFHPELTGRQNLFNSACLLGFDRTYLEDCMEDIQAFAELGEFFDRPIKLYSSGMYVRLAFSMFAFLDPEVLIIDEALSVGDVFFQQKSFARMHAMVGGGTTCIFVSHDTNAVQNLCRKAILLQRGEIAFYGDVKEAVSRYFGSIGSRSNSIPVENKRTVFAPKSIQQPDGGIDASQILACNILGNGARRHGAGGLKIIGARVTDRSGRDTLQVDMLDSLTFDLLLLAEESIVDPNSGIHLFDRFGNLVFAAGTKQMGQRLPDLSAGEELVVRLVLWFNVQPGEYTFSLGASEPSSDHGPNVGYLHDRCEMLGPVVVTAAPEKISPFYGIARLPLEVYYCLLPSSE